MKNNKKINCFFDGFYLFSTCKYKNIKALKNYILNNFNNFITIASAPDFKKHKIDNIKKYTFKYMEE